MSADKNTNLVQNVCKIQYQFIENVESISRGSSNFHAIVTLSVDNDWLDLYHSPASVSLEEPFLRTNAGRLYEDKITLKYPGEDEDTIEEIDNLVGPGLILRLHFSNGRSKVIGDIANPVKIIPGYISGSDGTGYTININHKSNHQAYWFDTESGGGGTPD